MLQAGSYLSRMKLSKQTDFSSGNVTENIRLHLCHQYQRTEQARWAKLGALLLQPPQKQATVMLLSSRGTPGELPYK